ncbi:MAG: Arm DNA-binding domain-containing protein [Oscillospiraceae bacterium]|nr:Arm DNA-binding domain-containing protein [Oscillospiraceae bacterium]
MPVYKDEKRNTWYAMFYATDWQGIKRKHKKRGFITQRKAKDYEREFLTKNSKLPDIRFGEMVRLYLEDRKNRVRNSTLKTREHMLETHVLPYFKNRIVSEIDHADIRAWQNTMLAKKKSAERRGLRSHIPADNKYYAVNGFQLCGGVLQPASQSMPQDKKHRKKTCGRDEVLDTRPI